MRPSATHFTTMMLGAEVKLTQMYAPMRPHRWVNNEAANKLAAPLHGPLDRLRDLARHTTRR
ncbi:hypothetical protein [Streptomyces gossypiisoli]|uniref:hypothetical protein n=1 Tax=Streptomyces gossypiisoli TaxID=2748864 RepID=UPI001E54C29F|nr:hypothetical protein [Streptomyces gossypiisoli]